MKSNLSSREANVYIVYMLLFLVVSVALVSWLAFRNYNTNSDAPKATVYDKVKKDRQFVQKQKDALVLIDTTYKSIRVFNPGLNAVYADNDIKNQLKNIKSYYIQGEGDIRYKIFDQTADLYLMWLEDKKVLQKKQSNVRLFRDQLQKCQVGFKTSQNKMNLKVAQDQGSSQTVAQ